MENNIWQFKQLQGQEEKLGQINRQVNYLIANFSEEKGTEPDASLILDNIWLGNKYVAEDYNFVTNKKIRFIINATTETYCKFPFIEYIQFPINDENACRNNYLWMMNIGADFINSAVQNNHAILVHCKRGHHRSASILAYFLMKYCNLSLVDAIITIKKKRPTAFRKMTCMLQTLIYYEYYKTK